MTGLASATDLARHWGVSKQRAHQIVRTAGFPRPSAFVNGHPAWSVGEADEWRHKRRTSVRTWPCPKCGSTDTHRDELDGYCRICDACGYRAAFEAFAPRDRN